MSSGVKRGDVQPHSLAFIAVQLHVSALARVIFCPFTGADKFPVIVFVPEKFDIRSKEKGRRSLRSVAFFVCLAGQGGVHIP